MGKVWGSIECLPHLVGPPMYVCLLQVIFPVYLTLNFDLMIPRNVMRSSVPKTDAWRGQKRGVAMGRNNNIAITRVFSHGKCRNWNIWSYGPMFGTKCTVAPPNFSRGHSPQSPTPPWCTQLLYAKVFVKESFKLTGFGSATKPVRSECTTTFTPSRGLCVW